jgi:hypothetical protein
MKVFLGPGFRRDDARALDPGPAIAFLGATFEPGSRLWPDA